MSKFGDKNHPDPTLAQKKSVAVRKKRTELRNQTEQYADQILAGDAGYKLLQSILNEAHKRKDLSTLRWAYELIEGKAKIAAEIELSGEVTINFPERFEQAKDNDIQTN